MPAARQLASTLWAARVAVTGFDSGTEVCGVGRASGGWLVVLTWWSVCKLDDGGCQIEIVVVPGTPVHVFRILCMYRVAQGLIRPFRKHSWTVDEYVYQARQYKSW